jgi:hypothetical protein
MAKITSFMRVTKQPKAHGKKVDTSPVIKKQTVGQSRPVVAKKEPAELSEDVPTFIYEVAICNVFHNMFMG